MPTHAQERSTPHTTRETGETLDSQQQQHLHTCCVLHCCTARAQPHITTNLKLGNLMDLSTTMNSFMEHISAVVSQVRNGEPNINSTVTTLKRAAVTVTIVYGK